MQALRSGGRRFGGLAIGVVIIGMFTALGLGIDGLLLEGEGVVIGKGRERGDSWNEIVYVLLQTAEGPRRLNVRPKVFAAAREGAVFRKKSLSLWFEIGSVRLIGCEVTLVLTFLVAVHLIGVRAIILWLERRDADRNAGVP